MPVSRGARTAALLALAFGLGACGSLPPTAPRAPWFETEPDLAAKAERISADTLARVDPAGLLLYHAWDPLTDPLNQLRSHDLADAPAWQGYLLAAVAFEEAVSGADRDAEIRRLAGGLGRFYEVTGVRGLFGRSMIADYAGPRLEWMVDEAARPTRFWMQGPTGAWWRNGLAKAHLTLACFGCAMPLMLERRGDLGLEPGTRRALLDVLLPAVHHLASSGFRIRDWDGRFTEFGDLSPQGLNGFNMVCVLSLLASAAPYDPVLAALYEDKLEKWGPAVAWSLGALGDVMRAVGHAWIGKPSYSDLQCLALAAASVFLQEERAAAVDPLRRGLAGLWPAVRGERNAPFTLCCAAFVDGGAAARALEEVLQDLRDFPVAKPIPEHERVATRAVQPLANRPPSSNYWKSSPYSRVRLPVGEPTGRSYAGQDFLLVYWMGRYLGLVPAR
ncbi:MAG: hypothetical protein JXQ29_12365 [Planctomycetes bacterium]|nr:hypothetical protein [Planctomycetota bacterium]